MIRPILRRIRAIRPITGVALGALLLIGTIGAPDALGGPRQGDRLGIRGGVWPQPGIQGILGTSRLEESGTIDFDARIDEDASIVPYTEAYLLLHLRGPWWFEGSLGWGARWGIQVDGVAPDSVLELGSGRADFFPIFLGVRVVDDLGEKQAPHNIYARFGPSAVPANESPSSTEDRLLDNGIYSPGTEIAIGFLVGGGGEYYLSPTFALTADVSYRYTNFVYGRNAKFNLSSIWAGVGVTLRTR